MTPRILDPTKLRRRQLARLSQARGKQGQILAENRLRALGLVLVEGVTTPSVTTQNLKRRFIKKVSGDIRAVIPGSGRSVLVEVKSRPDSLSVSDFGAHQIQALIEHANAGGLSLIVWVKVNSGIVVMEAGDVLRCMVKGSPLHWGTAQGLGIKNNISEVTA